MPEAKQSKPDLQELAKKKRHIYLVEKLQRGKPLSKKEIDELGEFEQTNQKRPKPWIVDTQEEVAEAISISPRRVRYMKRAGMPVEEDGRYNVVLIERWRHRDDDINDDGWDEKNKEIKYKVAELKLKQMEGELISRDEVEQGLLTRIAMVKRVMFSVPRGTAVVVAGMNDPREIEAYLTEVMREICYKFAGKRDDNTGQTTG